MNGGDRVAHRPGLHHRTHGLVTPFPDFSVTGLGDELTNLLLSFGLKFVDFTKGSLINAWRSFTIMIHIIILWAHEYDFFTALYNNPFGAKIK